MKIFILTINVLFGTLIGFHSHLFAQNEGQLFMPRNIKKAYEKGTRAYDGRPGAKYWQNKAQYVMRLSVTPKTRILSGEETITYYNNSPDTLKLIRLKLSHDRYKKGNARDFWVNPADVSDAGVQIGDILFNNNKVPAENLRRFQTFLDVKIEEKPLVPGAQVVLQVSWSYTIPAGEDAARECVCDSTTFFIPYFYPQIAVYDDLQGWATKEYSGLQEQYNDFADYDVTIALPKGFMAWATGELQNVSDLLTDPYRKRWEIAHQSDEVISIFTEKELQTGQVFKPAGLHVFRFEAANVPDFAFGFSDHYNWDATSVMVDGATKRRAFVSAAYHTNSKDYYRVAGIAAKGLRLMSTWLPGYPYPYPTMTVFNGNDGMEFPMIVNDASTGDRDPTGLTVHETGHTYFPFMMGINEQDYAWMDEGWTAFFDLMLTDSLTGGRGTVRSYAQIAGTDSDVPPMVKARYLSSPAYRNASYNRPQMAYASLLDLLGYDVFHRCMVEYMNRWKGKHPQPYDFFFTWNEVSKQDLSWFWKPWFFEWGYPDLAITGVVRDEPGNADAVLIRRSGQFPTPIHLAITYSDGSRQTLHETAAIWRDGKMQYKILASKEKTIQSLELGHRLIPDANPADNIWKK